MSVASYADVLCPDFGFNTGCNGVKGPGALVRIGTNTGPVYEVVAVDEGTAWVREPRTGRGSALVPVWRLRMAEPMEAMAA